MTFEPIHRYRSGKSPYKSNYINFYAKIATFTGRLCFHLKTIIIQNFRVVRKEYEIIYLPRIAYASRELPVKFPVFS